MLARGTVAEVVEEAHLSTWAVDGPDLSALAERLRGRPGVKHVVVFGDVLHVSGNDADALERAIAAFRTEQHRWRRIRPGIEDVFIHLMERADEGPHS